MKLSSGHVARSGHKPVSIAMTTEYVRTHLPRTSTQREASVAKLTNNQSGPSDRSQPATVQGSGWDLPVFVRFYSVVSTEPVHKRENRHPIKSRNLTFRHSQTSSVIKTVCFKEMSSTLVFRKRAHDHTTTPIKYNNQPKQ